MKQTLNKISNGLIALLFISLAMLACAALFSSCTRKIKVQDPPHAYPDMDTNKSPSEAYYSDPVKWIPFMISNGSTQYVNLDSLINSKVVVDTVMIAGEVFEFHDSIPCPEGLDKDSIMFVTFTKYLPSRSIPVSVTVMDTLWLNKPCPTCPTLPTIPAIGGGWGERLALLSTITALLLGYWRQWRNTRKTTTVTG